MAVVVFSTLGILFLLSIPIITARLAKRVGRNPMTWFFLGLCLPVIATFILFLLPDLSEQEHS